VWLTKSWVSSLNRYDTSTDIQKDASNDASFLCK
jgi:hypothetical protein